LRSLDAVDALLAETRFGSDLMKIKTMGDYVLFASLPPSADAPLPVSAVAAAVRLALTLAGNQQGVTMKAGIHVGQLIGCVLGLERLSFDVFGDTVNTASRLMSTASSGDVAMSNEAHALLRSTEGDAVDDPMAGLTVTETARHMKGKGLVTTFVVSVHGAKH
jgi:adenylate cyclase